MLFYLDKQEIYYKKMNAEQGGNALGERYNEGKIEHPSQLYSASEVYSIRR